MFGLTGRSVGGKHKRPASSSSSSSSQPAHKKHATAAGAGTAAVVVVPAAPSAAQAEAPPLHLLRYELEFAVVYLSLLQTETTVDELDSQNDDEGEDEDGAQRPSHGQNRQPRYHTFRYGPIRGNALLAWRTKDHTFDRRDYALAWALDLAVRTVERTLKPDFVALVQRAAATAAAAAARGMTAAAAAMRQEDHTLREVQCLSAINADLLCALMLEVRLSRPYLVPI